LKGCTPFVYRGCVSVSPFKSKNRCYAFFTLNFLPLCGLVKNLWDNSKGHLKDRIVIDKMDKAKIDGEANNLNTPKIHFGWELR
jgi:hypothetical protein